MKNNRFLWIFVVIISIIGAMFITIDGLGKTKGQIPDTADSRQIQETIKLSYEIEAQAAHTYDVSAFPTVFINDSRGPKIDGTVLDLVRSVRNDPSLTEDSVGYLDYKLAYYAWRAKGALLYEQVWAKARSEGRDYLTEEESQSLTDTSGQVYPPRMYAPGIPTTIVFTTNITFISISIDGEVAKAVFDDGSQKIEMTLVKKDGKWYIAGIRILLSHP